MISLLGARYILRGWAFITLNDIKGDILANFKIVKCHAVYLAFMEENILSFAFLSSNKSKSFFRH